MAQSSGTCCSGERTATSLIYMKAGASFLSTVDGSWLLSQHYLSLEDNVITRANAEQRMLEKLTKSLTEDIA